jgi:hypothetical protein
MYKIVWLYDKIETYVIVGGVAFFIYLLVKEFCNDKIRKVLKLAYGTLFVLILLFSMFGIDDKIKKPDMDDNLYNYAQSVVSLVDTVAKNDMPLDSFKEILNSYIYTYKNSTEELTKLENNVFEKMYYILDEIECEYLEEFDENGKDEYGYPLLWQDISDYRKNDIIELRDELAELIKLSPYYDENVNYREDDRPKFWE